MDHSHEHGEDKHEHFSLLSFVTTIIVSFVLSLIMVRIIAPDVWRVQIEASWLSIALVFLGFHLFNAFGEYFFHRYVLHSPLVPGLYTFYKSHTRHHGLTHVVLRKVQGTDTKEGIVENVYPILEEKQHEASFFPWYSYIVFTIIGCSLYIPLQLLLPQSPIILGAFLSVAWSLSLYEILHAIQHWSLEKWRPLLQSKRFGVMWKKVYGFHLRHHADILSNESISGFFGIPIADFVFGTWVNPATLYPHGERGHAEAFVPPPPRFIGWLDRIAEWRRKHRRQRR